MWFSCDACRRPGKATKEQIFYRLKTDAKTSGFARPTAHKHRLHRRAVAEVTAGKAEMKKDDWKCQASLTLMQKARRAWAPTSLRGITGRAIITSARPARVLWMGHVQTRVSKHQCNPRIIQMGWNSGVCSVSKIRFANSTVDLKSFVFEIRPWGQATLDYMGIDIHFKSEGMNRLNWYPCLCVCAWNRLAESIIKPAGTDHEEGRLRTTTERKQLLK